MLAVDAGGVAGGARMGEAERDWLAHSGQGGAGELLGASVAVEEGPSDGREVGAWAGGSAFLANDAAAEIGRWKDKQRRAEVETA